MHMLITSCSSDKEEILSADAVKFGGGMGNIARNRLRRVLRQTFQVRHQMLLKLSRCPVDITPREKRYPRFTEGARVLGCNGQGSMTLYILQMQEQMIIMMTIMSRGRWGKCLSGGSVKNPKEKGYNIPVDMAFAFHTDAGTTLNDSIVGTLSIYTRLSNG